MVQEPEKALYAANVAQKTLFIKKVALYAVIAGIQNADNRRIL